VGAWEDGFAAGWRAARSEVQASGFDPDPRPLLGSMRKARRGASSRRSGTKKRAASAYSKRYGSAFKRLAPRYKKKSGGWKKDGFKRCSAAARKAAKR
jgi:hypothetical protein